MAATCMAVCKGSRKKIRGIFISSCHLPAAVECDIVILSEPGPNPTGPSWAVLQHNLSPRGDGNSRVARISSSDIKHNLSPRGDGNVLHVDKVGEFRTQLIPARGRKQLRQMLAHETSRHNLSPRGDGNNFVKLSDAPIAEDTTYPREGMETFCQHISYPLFQRYNLSP